MSGPTHELDFVARHALVVIQGGKKARCMGDLSLGDRLLRNVEHFATRGPADEVLPVNRLGGALGGGDQPEDNEQDTRRKAQLPAWTMNR
jgi:hypothetical protein